MLFALLAVLPPAFDAPQPGREFQENESREHVSAPADPRSGDASLVRATLSVAEDLEEEADEDEADKATFLALATLDCDPGAGYLATDAWFPSFRRPSAHFGTGPPTL